jgi:transcriptional regulator with XRE-family HTH domain
VVDLGLLRDMAVADDTIEGIAETVGAKLRILRRARGYSLAQVAEATGVSRSLLHLIETGKNDPTIGRLIRLTTFYDVNVTELLPDSDDGQPEIVRHDHQRRISSRSEKIDLFILAPSSDRIMEPVIGVYQAGGGTSDFFHFDAQMFLHVLEGKIELIFKDEEPIILDVGDSAYFSGRRPHRYRNPAEVESRILYVRSPAS